MDTLSTQIKAIINRDREHNKYSNHLPSQQKNTSGQRRFKRQREKRYESIEIDYLMFDDIDDSSERR